MNYISWFIAFLVFLGVELITLGLTSIWFAVGALVAFFAAFFGAPVFVQFILFVVVSTIVLVFVRPFAVKYVNNNTEKTNVESMAGKTGKVTARIDDIEGTGQVIIDGMEWTAKTENGDPLEVGELVTVLRIEGVKAVVRKSDFKEQAK